MHTDAYAYVHTGVCVCVCVCVCVFSIIQSLLSEIQREGESFLGPCCFRAEI